jgi:hypothetical protein
LIRAITPFVLTVAILFLAAPTPAWAQHEGAAVTDTGPRLPMPWGLGFTIYGQRQPYDIVELQVPLAGLDIGAAEGLDIENQTESMHLKFDYWVLPFLNVFALGGHIDGATRVKLSGVDLGLPIVLNDLKIDYSGLMYGGGATLAVGGKKWFATLTYESTWTDLDVRSSSVRGQVVTPTLGLIFKGAAVYVGAMYQKAEETHEGIFEVPFLGAVPYYAELRQGEPWNYHVGMRAGISKHWNLNFKGGFGTRKSAMVSLGYRFGKPKRL